MSMLIHTHTHTQRPYLGLLGRLLLPRAFFGKSWFLIYAHRLVNVGTGLSASYTEMWEAAH